jgi:predicted GNAT family acetyltransferase
VSAPDLRRDDRAHRYELRLDGAVVGVATYEDAGDERTIVHTIVDEDHEGHGLGTALVEFALRDIRSTGMTLVPRCPMVAAYIDDHPGWDDLVPGRR